MTLLFISALSNFGEGRGAMTTSWWLVIPTLLVIIGIIIYRNTKGKK